MKRKSRHERGYNSAWEKARAGYLRSHPLCVMCHESGKAVPATVVDHKQPHKGDSKLFWDKDNWQALCKQHHDSTKQRDEYRGYTSGCDVSGVPLDAGHHWQHG